MEVSRIRALRGPNLWSRHTAHRSHRRLHRRRMQHRRPARLRAARARAVPRHRRAAPDRPRRRRCRWPMCSKPPRSSCRPPAGCPITFSHTAPPLEAGTYQVVVEYSEEAVGRLAFELAQALIHAALRDTAFDLDAAIAQLRDLDEDERLGPSTGAIVDAAVARGIPYRRLTKGSMVQFGWGAQAAPHPGRRGRLHQRRRRIHRAGQRPHQTAAACRRRAGAARPARHRPRRRLGRGPAGRPARGRQAAGRQPGQGRHGQHQHARAPGGRLQGRRRTRRGHGRKIPARQRLPPAGGRQQAGRRLAPRTAAGGGRRPAHRARTRRHRQPGPAARRRPRHLAHQDPL